MLIFILIFINCPLKLLTGTPLTVIVMAAKPADTKSPPDSVEPFANITSSGNKPPGKKAVELPSSEKLNRVTNKVPAKVLPCASFIFTNSGIVIVVLVAIVLFALLSGSAVITISFCKPDNALITPDC